MLHTLYIEVALLLVYELFPQSLRQAVRVLIARTTQTKRSLALWVGTSFTTTRVAVGSNSTEAIVVHQALLVEALDKVAPLVVLTSAVRVIVACHRRTTLGDT